MKIQSNKLFEYIEFIKNLNLFNNILDEDILNIIDSVKIKKFQKGELLLCSSNSLFGVLISYEGNIKLAKINEHGDEMILGLFQKSGVIFPMYFSEHYDATVEFLSDSTLLCFPESLINNLVSKNPIFAKNIIDILADNIQALMQIAVAWRLKNTQEKLGWFLASTNSNNFGKLPFSKSLIASYLGMKSESLSRTLKKLGNEGIYVENNIIKQKTGKELCKYCDKDIGVNCTFYGSKKDCLLF